VFGSFCLSFKIVPNTMRMAHLKFHLNVSVVFATIVMVLYQNVDKM